MPKGKKKEVKDKREAIRELILRDAIKLFDKEPRGGFIKAKVDELVEAIANI